MKIYDLVQKLLEIQLEHGNIDVMFYNDHDNIREVNYASFRVAEEDEFDPDWDMPEGFKFVELCQ